MLRFFAVLVGDITIKINGATWSIILSAILYLIIAAIIGLIAEFIMKDRLPFGFIGAIIAALIGIWLITQIIIIQGIGDFYIFDIPLIRTLIGAIIFAFIWRIITIIISIMAKRRSYGTA